MSAVYSNQINPSTTFELTPPTFLETGSDTDRLTPSPASYPIPVPTTISPSSCPTSAISSPGSCLQVQPSTCPFPTFYPSPDSSHDSPGSPSTNPLPEATAEPGNYPETNLATGASTYPQGVQQYNFYDYMYSSFPNYQYQNPLLYTQQDSSVPGAESYSVTPYFVSHPYYPYIHSNRSTTNSNLYSERSTANTSLVPPSFSIIQPSGDTSTTVQHAADSSTDHYPSSTILAPETSDPSPKYPPVLIKGGGKIRAKPVKRTEFSAADLRILEEHFAVSDFARGVRRDEIARQLNVRPRSITIWFQNRRAKLRARNQQLDLLKKAAETGVVQDIEKISDFR